MGIWIGHSKADPREPIGLKWNSDTIKIYVIPTDTRPTIHVNIT